VDEPFRSLDAEPLFDRLSWVGPEPGQESSAATRLERVPPAEPRPSAGAPRADSVSFPDLDFGVSGSPADLREPEPVRPQSGTTGTHAPGDRLDLFFEDLAIPTGGAGPEATGSAVDMLDLDAVLKEESDAGIAVPPGGVEPSMGPAIGESVDLARDVESPGHPGGAAQPAPAGPLQPELGLPDQWLDLTEPAGEPAPAPAADGVGLDLDMRGGDLSGPPAPGLDLDLGPVAPPASIPPLEPVVPASPRDGIAIRATHRDAKRRSTGLKVVVLGVVIVLVVGVILGQTEYGYFGASLFMPSETELATGRRVVTLPSAGIGKDTPAAYLNEVRRLDAILREHPDDLSARADLLEVLMRYRERFPAALAADEKLSRRLAELEKGTQVTGQKATMVRVLSLVNGGQYAEARAILDGMVAASAQDPDVLYYFGKIALGQGKHEEAQKYFELALLKDPDFLAARYFLARTQIERGDVTNGKKVLEEVIAKEPGHLASKVLLAQVAMKDGDADEAARLAGEVVQKADSAAYREELFSAHLVLASVHEAAGRKDETLQELTAALSLRPTDADTATRAARILMSNGKNDEAVNLLNPCWEAQSDSLPFLAAYLEAVLAIGDESKAQAVLDRGTQKHPDAPDLAIIHGKYLLGIERIRSAATAFETAIKVAPESEEGYLWLAEALRRDGRPGEAIRQLTAGLNRVRDRVALLKRLAALYREVRDLASAEETLRQVLGMDPSNVEVQESLGLVVLALGRVEEAVTILGALNARHALSQDGLLGLARAYLAMRKPAKAREVLAQVYGKKGQDAEEDPTVAAEYGRALLEAGQTREAEDVLAKVLADRPGFAPGHYYMGRVHAAKGEVKAAIDALVRAVQLDPKDTRYRLELARILKQRGSEEDIREAQNQLSKVIEAYQRAEVPAEERDADAYVLRGEILFQQQKFGLAMKDFEAALALQPARMDILIGYGRSLFELARYDEAAPYFRQVLARDPKQPEANFFLGQILLRAGDVEGAKTHLERVAQRSPERFPEALRLVGLIYRDQNLKPLARKAFQSYLAHAPKGTAEFEEVRRLLDKMR